MYIQGQNIYGIYMILTASGDYLCVQHSSISLSDGSTLCSLWSM